MEEISHEKNVVPGSYVILENVFGLMGTVIWSFQLVPQVYKNWRRKSTRGLSQMMILLWTISNVFYGTYAIVLNLSIPLIIQPQLFGIICLFVDMQFLYYDSPKLKGNKVKNVTLFILSALLFAGCEVGSVYGIREANATKIRWPEKVFGIVSPVLLISGFVPQYIQIYKEKHVIGISMIFMALDMAGALFSVLSLVFRPPPFDTIASLTYISVFVLDGLIVLLYYFLNWFHARKNHNDEEFMVYN
ncbi:10499_t:CDS:2 [Funneliformis caledonium]|uniref:10499_t:CDS:1 n=1 Tax=Funneliformis caledonium TaxID=1117310 RepID=A0A9N9GSP0_9GLOM|nr:10499_t:CDS:2 [Funneliformis caledonium]